MSEHPVVLVTGGAGFIGQALVQALLAQDFGVTVLDDLFNSAEPPHPGRQHRYTFIKGGVQDAAIVRQALQGVTHVVHLAAQASVPASLENPADTYLRNIHGTEILLDEVRKARQQGGCGGWVLLASSAAVYGGADASKPLPEEAALGQELKSPYAASKLINEVQAQAYRTCFGVPTLALRFFNVYGPGQRADHPYAGFVAKVVHSIQTGELLTIYGDGSQTRDFISVDDVAHAMVQLLQRPVSMLAQTPFVVNVGTGTAVSLLDTIRQVVAITRVNPRVKYVNARPGDLHQSCASPARLMEVLPQWRSTPLALGLRKWLVKGEA